MAEVTVRSLVGLSQQVEMRDHRLLVDEPREAGGGDTGPTPYELLLAALGSCTAITLRLYADRKGWPLESIEVVLSHDRVHAEDCLNCETREGFLDRIKKRLTLGGPLEPAQRERLLEIADRCPVQRTMQREMIIESQHAPAV